MMKQPLFEREVQYQTMMIVCRSMQEKGFLAEKDVAAAERLLNEKYRPVFRAQ